METGDEAGVADEPEERRPVEGRRPLFAWSALALAVGSVLVFIFLGQLVPAALLGIRSEADIPASLHVLLAFSPLAGLACVGLAKRLRLLPRPPREPASWRLSLLVGAGGGVAALAGSVALAALQARLGAPVEEQQVLVRALHASPSPALLAGMVLFVPIGEELVFRRLGFAALRAQNGAVAAYAWSAVVFALVHMNPSGFLVYAWVGLLAGVAYERTGRIEVAIALHAVNNALAVLT